MPLGWERINVKKTHPNKNIIFIKPLTGRDQETSKDFLERIAAQCLPIMNKNHLAVVSLEEYEYNPEFLGRNFNNGEVIQLVLKSHTGQWLPFKFVQMTMMHELAHNKQMNHSAAFHRVRIGFQTELKALWDKGYTGDGLWGRGVLLENGAFARNEAGEDEILPEHLCGGTFKSRGGRKRRIKPKITYKEAQERRIRKKFGTNGVILGADEETKAKLEKGKKPAGKPRVAGSARGRELRAAAAMARFESKEEPEHKDDDLVTDSETESDSESDVFIKTEKDDAVDLDGRRLFDKDGLPLHKVCEDQDKSDEFAINELLELRNFGRKDPRSESSKEPTKSWPAAPQAIKPVQPLKKQKEKASRPVQITVVRNNSKKTPEPVKEGEGEYEDTQNATKDSSSEKTKAATKPRASIVELSSQSSKPIENLNEPRKSPVPELSTSKTIEPNEQAITKLRVNLVERSCPICSMESEPTALTCIACSNVLKPEFVPGAWRCKTSPCKGTEYINAGDVGLCGICGTRP